MWASFQLRKEPHQRELTSTGTAQSFEERNVWPQWVNQTTLTADDIKHCELNSVYYMLLKSRNLPHTSGCLPQCISARSDTLREMQWKRCQALVQSLDSARKKRRLQSLACILWGHSLARSLYVASKPLTWHCRMHSWCFLGLQPNWKVVNWPAEQPDWLGTTAGTGSAQTHWIWAREPSRSGSAWCPLLLYLWWWWCFSTTEMIHGLIRHPVIFTQLCQDRLRDCWLFNSVNSISMAGPSWPMQVFPKDKGTYLQF